MRAPEDISVELRYLGLVQILDHLVREQTNEITTPTGVQIRLSMNREITTPLASGQWPSVLCFPTFTRKLGDLLKIDLEFPRLTTGTGSQYAKTQGNCIALAHSKTFPPSYQDGLKFELTDKTALRRAVSLVLCT